MHLAVGSCDTHQFLWGGKYGDAVRLLLQKDGILVLHFLANDTACSAEGKVQSFPMGGCTRVRDDVYLRFVGFNVAAGVRMSVRGVYNGEVLKDNVRIFPDGYDTKLDLKHGKIHGDTKWLRFKMDRLASSLKFVLIECGEHGTGCQEQTQTLKCGGCMRVDKDEGYGSRNHEKWCFTCDDEPHTRVLGVES